MNTKQLTPTPNPLNHSTDTGKRTTDFTPRMRVRYIPAHAFNNPQHPDAKVGAVSTVDEAFVFVKFSPNQSVGHACHPHHLLPV